MSSKIKLIPKIWQLWRSNKRYRIAYGGRGSGKSYGIAQVMAIHALTEQCVLLCTKETQNTLSDSALAIINRVIYDAGWNDYFVSTKHGLGCIVTGSEFVFRGLQNPDRIKSLEGVKYCWVEEAQSVSKSAWDILSPTVRADDSEIWASFNPKYKDDPAYTMFVDNEHTMADVVEMNYPDNPHFTNALRMEMEYDKANDYEKYKHVWLGNCITISDALVFHGKYRSAVFEEPTDDKGRSLVDAFYYGADWGFSRDPSVALRCYIYDDVLYITHEAYGVGVDIDRLPQFFETVPGMKEWPSLADSSRPDTINYMRNHGYPRMMSTKKGKGSIEDGVAFMRSFREIVVHERCKRTLAEFGMYSYKVDPKTEQILPVIVDKHNHCMDTIRYALEPVMRTAKATSSSFSAKDLGL